MMTPHTLQQALPLSATTQAHIRQARQQLSHILHKKDDRLVVVIGPCSIHDTDAALKYAQKLKDKIDTYRDTLCIVMRAYIEKSRTTVGWKGLVNDPDLNKTFAIEKGLHKARSILLAINALGVPTATEIVNPFTAPYFLDITSFVAIGARSTESQLHRELASVLPMPVGFKNNTSGNIQVAIDAVKTAHESHHFLGLNSKGRITTVQSHGNPDCHVILRGSHTHTNYDENTILHTAALLEKTGLTPRIMVDCSHGNSQKNHTQQAHVLHSVANTMQHAPHAIFGVMIESHLVAGNQTWAPNQPLVFGQSITDACMGWDETEAVLAMLNATVSEQRRLLQCAL